MSSNDHSLNSQNIVNNSNEYDNMQSSNNEEDRISAIAFINEEENRDKTTYEKIVIFFEDHQILNFNNFEAFLNFTDLNNLIYYKDLKNLWEKFQFIDSPSEKIKKNDFDFNTTINLLERLLEQNTEETSVLTEDVYENKELEVAKPKKLKHTHKKAISDCIGQFRQENALVMYNLINQIDLKTKNFIKISEINPIIEKNKYQISQEEVIDFLTKIALTHNEELIYINMDLYRRAIQRFEQHLALKNLESNNNILTTLEDDDQDDYTSQSLLDDIILNENRNEEIFLIIKNLSKEHENLFDELIQNYHKVIYDINNPKSNSLETDKDIEQIRQNNLDCIKIGIEDLKIKIKDIELYNKKLEENHLAKVNKITKLTESMQTMQTNLTFFEDYFEKMEAKAKADSVSNKLSAENDKLKEELYNFEKNFEEVEKNLKEKIIECVELKDLNSYYLIEIEKYKQEKKNNISNNKIDEKTQELNNKINEDFANLQNIDNIENTDNTDNNYQARRRKYKKHVSLANRDEFLDLKKQYSINPHNSLQTEYQKLVLYSTNIEKLNASLEEKVKVLNLSFENHSKTLYNQNLEIKNLKNQLIALESKYSHADPKSDVNEFQEKSWFKRYKTVYQKRGPVTKENTDDEHEHGNNPETPKKVYLDTLEDCIGGDEENLFSGKDDEASEVITKDNLQKHLSVTNLSTLHLGSERKANKVLTFDLSEELRLPHSNGAFKHTHSQSTLPTSSEFILSGLNTSNLNNIFNKIEYKQENKQNNNLIIENNIQSSLNIVSPKKAVKFQIETKDFNINKDSSKENSKESNKIFKENKENKVIVENIKEKQEGFSLNTHLSINSDKSGRSIKTNNTTKLKLSFQDNLKDIAEIDFEKKASVSRQRLLTQIFQRKSLNNPISKQSSLKSEKDRKYKNIFDTNDTKINKNEKDLKEDSKKVQINNINVLNNTNNTSYEIKPNPVFKIYQSKLNFSENEKNFKANFDYLPHKHSVYQKLFQNEKHGYMFLDNVYIYDSPNVRSRDYYDLIVTSKNIYIINSEKNTLKLHFRLESFHRISISFKNMNLLVLHFNIGDDLLLFTYRRELLMNFIKFNYLKPNNKVIKFEVTDCIQYQVKKALKEYIVNQIEYKIDETIKIGFLKKYCIKVLKNIFVEKFAVLTNLGLIYFDTQYDKSTVPKRCVPIVGSSITLVNSNKYKQSFCFEIKGGDLNEVFVFSARSELEAIEWITALEKFKKNFEQKEIDFIENF